MNEGLPMYLQIAEKIETDILRGHFKADDQVPSMNEWSKILHINPATAGKGLNELVIQNILYKKRGLGMFVTEEAYSIILKKRKATFKHELLPQFLNEAERLHIEKEELIKMIRGEYHVGIK